MLLKNNGKLAVSTALIVACALCAGCTVNPQVDREMLAAPTSLSDAYTQAQLQFRLATTGELAETCDHSGCIESAQFDERVARIGARLAAAAYEKYPELSGRVGAFDFSVLDKSEPGTGSTAGGVVVVLRPVAAIAQSDEALGFVLAREVGHVVAQHHEENTGTSLIVSLLATVMAPATQVLKLIASVYSSATTIAASASVTAASFAGSKILVASYRPRQLDEADRIAMELLGSTGVAAADVAPGFAFTAMQARDDEWVHELQHSIDGLHAPVHSASVAAVPTL
jgi:predicted Zn-dependent protease